MQVNLKLPKDALEKLLEYSSESTNWAAFTNAGGSPVCFELEDEHCTCDGEECSICEGWQQPIIAKHKIDLQKGMQLSLDKYPHLLSAFMSVLADNPDNGMHIDGFIQLCTIGEFKYA